MCHLIGSRIIIQVIQHKFYLLGLSRLCQIPCRDLDRTVYRHIIAIHLHENVLIFFRMRQNRIIIFIILDCLVYKGNPETLGRNTLIHSSACELGLTLYLNLIAFNSPTGII